MSPDTKSAAAVRPQASARYTRNEEPQGDIPRALLESIRDSVIYTDMAGRILYWNAGATRIFGYSAAEMLRLTPALLYPDEAPERLANDLREVLAGRDYAGEWRGRRNDGSEVYVDVTTSLVRDGNGEPTGFLGIAKDITQRKRAEQELDRARVHLRLIADTAPALIAHLDGDRRYRFVNQSYAGRFGVTPEQVIGRYIWEVIGRDAYESLRPYVDQVLAGSPAEFEIEVPYGESGPHHIHCAYAPELGSDGAVLGLVAVITDITSRKRAEQALRDSEQHLRQLERLEAIGRLAGGVAHEANNQMTVVLGVAEFLLKDESLSLASRRDVGFIKRAAQRTAAVAQQLLAFGRRQITRLQVLDVNDMVLALEPALRRALGEGIGLRLDLGPELSPVSADQGQLEQMLQNLALNARDATQPGGSVTIETRDATVGRDFESRHGVKIEPGRYAVIRFRDTGQGMDVETVSHAFEPFYTTKGVGGGTGLGLASVYGTVKQHYGYILLESAPGQGATFEIYLPANASGG